ncbi:MAG: response regulator transcription factor [Saprospiraceae bacterium]|nr:response regulator transcription factor [Saprospiraceae bacterium]
MNVDRIIKIILADDHHLVRKGFRALLEEIPGIIVVGDAANGLELLELLQKIPADVVLLDVEMPGMGGIEACGKIQTQFVDTKVIMLTMRNDAEIVKQSVANGARGFLFKNTSPSELQTAIQKVASGEAYFSSEVTMLLLSQPQTNPALTGLTEREMEIIRLVAEGLSSAEIGEKLFISPRTVDTHRNNILQKLDLPNVAALVRFAMQHKLVS